MEWQDGWIVFCFLFLPVMSPGKYFLRDDHIPMSESISKTRNAAKGGHGDSHRLRHCDRDWSRNGHWDSVRYGDWNCAWHVDGNWPWHGYWVCHGYIHRHCAWHIHGHWVTHWDCYRAIDSHGHWVRHGHCYWPGDSRYCVTCDPCSAKQIASSK